MSVYLLTLDENIHTQEKRKIDTYTPLSVNLFRLYPEYTYEIVPIVLGATGLVTDSLSRYLRLLLQDAKTVKYVIPKPHRKCLLGSMRILKSCLSKKT